MIVRSLVHRIVAVPLVYDAVQFAAGAPLINRRLSRLIGGVARDEPGYRVLDVGGGTGLGRALWPPRCHFTCLDIDEDKLRRFRELHPADHALLASGTRIPADDRSMDAVMLRYVAHHLDDDELTALVAECARVLRAEGTMVFIDPLWVPTRPPGRLLWHYDRGSQPRSAATLRHHLEQALAVTRWEQFSVIHSYAMATLQHRPEPAGTPG